MAMKLGTATKPARQIGGQQKDKPGTRAKGIPKDQATERAKILESPTDHILERMGDPFDQENEFTQEEDVHDEDAFVETDEYPEYEDDPDGDPLPEQWEAEEPGLVIESVGPSETGDRIFPDSLRTRKTPDIRILGPVSNPTFEIPLWAVLNSRSAGDRLPISFIREKCVHLARIAKLLIKSIAESDEPSQLQLLRLRKKDLKGALSVHKSTESRLLGSVTVELPGLGLISLEELVEGKLTATRILDLIKTEDQENPWRREQIAEKIGISPQGVKDAQKRYFPAIPLEARRRKERYAKGTATWLSLDIR